MSTITIVAKATMFAGDEILLEIAKEWRDLKLTDMRKVRSWSTKQFNRLCSMDKRHTLVRVSYAGQLAQPPFTRYTGEMQGKNGLVQRRTGGLEIL